MTTSVLVTGAAGFLGRWFVKEHLKRGDFVYGIDDMSNPHSYWPEELPWLQRNETRADWFLQAAINTLENPDNRVGLTNWDIAYHFAAPVGGREKIENDPLFNAHSLNLDSLFFRWAVNRVATAVYPSSSAVYGVELQGINAKPLSEDLFSPTAEFWYPPDELYGLTKLVGEFLAYKSAGYGLNTLCIRPFSGYGEGQSSDYPIPSILARIKRRENPVVIWGSGEQKRDFIHVSDVVQATIARVEAGVTGYQAMNIASGQGFSFREIALLAAKIAGYHPKIATDIMKPAGVNARYGDTTEMRKYYTPTVDLAVGLARVLESL